MATATYQKEINSSTIPFVKYTSSLNHNLHYSLKLIEVSNDYIVNTDEHTQDPDITIHPINEIIANYHFDDEQNVNIPCSKEMVKELLKDHERIIYQLRKRVDYCSVKYQEVNSVDFVTTIIKEHQNIAGEFRKYLIK